MLTIDTTTKAQKKARLSPIRCKSLPKHLSQPHYEEYEHVCVVAFSKLSTNFSSMGVTIVPF